MNQQKKYTEDDLKRARLEGRKEAEEYLQERISFIQITNRHLLDEIMRLDWKSPVTGVLVPYPYALKIVKKLREKKLYGYASRLKQYINKSNPLNIERILDLMEKTRET